MISYVIENDFKVYFFRCKNSKGLIAVYWLNNADIDISTITSIIVFGNRMKLKINVDEECIDYG